MQTTILEASGVTITQNKRDDLLNTLDGLGLGKVDAFLLVDEVNTTTNEVKAVKSVFPSASKEDASETVLDILSRLKNQEKRIFKKGDMYLLLQNRKVFVIDADLLTR